MKRICVKTYGCQMNEYDSAKIAAIMREKYGFTPTENYHDADVIILNTCSVRAKAEEKLFSELGMLRKIKNIRPTLIIGVGGCVSVQEKENIFRRAPYVNFIFGPQTYHLLPQMYEAALRHNKTIDVNAGALEKFAHFPPPKIELPTAYVTIIEGCNHFCSYCVVPFTRGREVSRPFFSVMREVQELAKQGAKEIYFLGQNVNNYCDASDSNQTKTLVDLVQQTAAIDAVKRIRFITSHPQTFSPELIAIFKEPKVANHFHLPMQSGSNRILKAMRRGYTVEAYAEIIRQLRILRPDISVSSDFIVGFPGETAEDFQATLEVVRTLQLDNSYTFMYSPRPNTLAAKLKDDVSLSEKKRRLALLQDELKIQAKKISETMLGSIQTILVTDISKKKANELSGRTENNRIVHFKIEEPAKNMIGEMIKVKITEALDNCLRVELI